MMIEETEGGIIHFLLDVFKVHRTIDKQKSAK